MTDCWKTKNGEEIKIKDMSTQHIINCIKAIEEDRIQCYESIYLGWTGEGDGDGQIIEYINFNQDYILAFKNELKKRGVAYED